MIHKNNQPGYILTVTLAIIALCMFLSAYVFNKGFVFARFSQTMVQREKARQLAYGGIQLAISQLATMPKNTLRQASDSAKASTDRQGEKETPTSDAANLLKAMLPNLNKAQKFSLKQSIDGINGTITIALGSEEGKININRLYDFDKHKFIGEGQPNGDMKKVFQEIFALIKEKTNADLFSDFEKFLKERKYPLNDVSELLKIKGFEVFKNDLYYDPTAQSKENDQKQKIFLNDIFTLTSSKKEIDPWLFSRSIGNLLKLKSEKTNFDELLKSFKEQNDWKTDWDKVLKPIYDIEFNALPKSIASLLNPNFSPKMFNVFSQATVGNVTVSIFALLEREKSTGKDVAPIVHIRAIYLI